MKSKIVNIKEVKPNPNNPRIIKDDKFKLPNFPIKPIEEIEGGIEGEVTDISNK